MSNEYGLLTEEPVSDKIKTNTCSDGGVDMDKVRLLEKDFVEGGRDVAVKCWFTANGKPTPLMFKVMEDADIFTVNNIEVLETANREEYSTMFWKYRCRALMHGGRKVEFFLIFHSKWCRWKLYM